ncbi:MAG: hypothetical protein GY796_27260 [Chloroflexi bacterium]|nr:hypothetical protein [Chloroflexota bacterium]
MKTIITPIKVILASFLLAGVLWLGAILIQPTQSVRADLPPRPEPTATAVSTPTAVPTTQPIQSVPAKGAQIQLVANGALGNEWTVVEWQDPFTEQWTAVDGWQGNVDHNFTTTWWVAAADLGDGPFRWQVYANENGNLLTTSETFNLPEKAKQMVVVTVDLEQ